MSTAFRYLLLLALTSWCFAASAQNQLPSVSKKAQKFFDESTEPLNWDKFRDAEALLLKAVDAQHDFVQAHERLGYLYIKTKEFQKSYDHFLQVVTIAPNYSREAWYFLGLDALATLQFDSATAFIQRYRAVGKINAKREDDLKLLEADIAFAREAVKHPVPNKATCLDSNINTPNNEYYPSLTADMEYLYFTRQQKNPESRMTNEDIWFSKWVDGHWSVPLSVGSNINTPQFNEGAHSISPDGKTLFYTICEMPGGYGGCDIYMSKKDGNVWSKPVNLGPQINSRAKETQPCISTDGKALYFVSDREGNLGKLDIWVSYLQDNGEWGKPQNLGPNINSAGIDERPYIHPDGETLYFSSDGRPGMGDGDIYFSRKQPDGQWGKAENIGYPINSFNYEGGIFVSRDGLAAFYGTDRYSKNGDLDICSFPVPENARPHAVTYVKGFVTDQATKKPLAGSMEFIDLSTGKVANQTTSSSYDGSYLVTLPYGHDYALNMLRKGYLFYSEHFSLTNLNATNTFNKDVALAPIGKGEKMVLSNVFFATGSHDLMKESETELNKLVQFLQNNPTLKLEIQGHTDNVGKDADNLELSNQRAKAVVDFLVQAGIDKTRLTSKGYGATQPIAPNDTEEGRAQNRRTEFHITDY